MDVWQFEKVPPDGKKRGKGDSCDEDLERFRVGNMRKSKWQFIRTMNANFDSGAMFVTFTFRDGAVGDVRDVRMCNREWNKFSKRLRRKYGDFRWMLVVEFQDKNGRGAVHFHVVWDLPFIPKSELEELWGLGFIWINRIEHVDNVGAYVSKYMAEDLGDGRLRGLKAWRASQELKKPLVLRGDEARDFLSAYDVESHDAVYDGAYASEYHGLIQYRQYNLNRD